MWVCLGSDGRVLEYFTEDGLAPRAGTTNFKIYITMDATLSGVNRHGIDFTEYNAAALKLYRPDYDETSLLNFPLTKGVDVVFEYPSNPQSKFIQTHKYNCYILDFGAFEIDDEVVAVLNMAGTWTAIATLFGTDGAHDNVVGSITFTVQEGNSNEDYPSTQDLLDMTLNGVYREMATFMTLYTSQIATGQKEFRYDMSGGITNHTRTIIDGWGVETQRFTDAEYTTPQGKMLKIGATYDHVDPFITFGEYTIEFPEKSGRLVVDTDEVTVLGSGSTPAGKVLKSNGTGGTMWGDAGGGSSQDAVNIVKEVNGETMLDTLFATFLDVPVVVQRSGRNERVLLNILHPASPVYIAYAQRLDSNEHAYYYIYDNSNSGHLSLNNFLSDTYKKTYIVSDEDLASQAKANTINGGKVLAANSNGATEWKNSIIEQELDIEDVVTYAGKTILVKYRTNNEYYLLSVKENVANVNYTARAVPLNESTLGFYYASGFASLTFADLINSTYLKTAIDAGSDLATQTYISADLLAGQALESNGAHGAEWSEALPYANRQNMGNVKVTQVVGERPFLLYFTNQYVNGYFWGRVEQLGTNGHVFYFENLKTHEVYKSSSTVAGTTTLDDIFTGPSSPYYVAPVKKTYKHRVTINATGGTIKFCFYNTDSTVYTTYQSVYENADLVLGLIGSVDNVGLMRITGVMSGNFTYQKYDTTSGAISVSSSTPVEDVVTEL